MVQAPPKVPPQQIALALRQIIQSVYRDGVDAVLSFDLNDSGNISGVFRDDRQLYNYTITDDGEISYVERDVKRGDSYLEGYYLTNYVPLNGASTAYTKGAIETLVRLDKSKQRQCSVGKSCGNTCIAKGVRCTQELGVRQQQALKEIRSAMPARLNPSSEVAKYLLGGALVAGSAAGLAAMATKEEEKTNQYYKNKYKSEYKNKYKDKVDKEKKKLKSSQLNTSSAKLRVATKVVQPKNQVSTKSKLSQIKNKIVGKATEPKQLTLADLENQMNTTSDLESAKKQITTEEKVVAAQKEKVSDVSNREISKSVAKELGFDPDVEEELRRMQSIQEEDRSKRVAGKIKTTLIGRSRTEAPIQINERSKEIDIKGTLTNLGIGNPNSPVVDMDTVGQAIKSHTARRLHGEHQKGIDDIATDAFRAMETTKLIPNQQKKSEARQRIRIQTAQRLQQFNKEFFGVAKKSIGDTKTNFQEFGKDANEAQLKGRAMSSDKIKYYQQAFSTTSISQNLTDASVRVRNQISLNPKRVVRSGMTDKKAKQIISGVNKLIQQRSEARFKRPIREDSIAYLDLVKKLIAIAAW